MLNLNVNLFYFFSFFFFSMNSSSLKTPTIFTNKEAPREEDWFDNVENLKPLRGGRRADTLNEIASGSLRISSEDAEKKFHEDFLAATKSDDPLGILWNYANWFEEHFPTGKNCLFYPILYKVSKKKDYKIIFFINNFILRFVQLMQSLKNIKMMKE